MTMIAGLPKAEYRKRAYQENRARLVAVLGDSCVRCGTRERLEFDHIDPAKKAFTIKGDMSAADPVVLAELMKCQLLCRECHYAKTREDIFARGFTHGTWYGWNRKKCGCTDCTKARQDYNQRRTAARRAKKAA